MAESVGSIYYTVEADTKKLLDSVRPADSSLDHLQQTFSRTDKAANQANFQMNKTAAAVRGIGKESQAASVSLGSLAKLVGGLVTLQGANSLIQMAEGYREMAERIQMATSSQEEYEMVQARLLSTANGTYRSMTESQEVFVRTADSLRTMGYDTSAALDITDSLSYAFVRSATSADRASIAIGAFSRSLSKGRVDSDAWEMLLISIPTLAQDMAEAIGKTSEEVRKLGAEGKLTTQQLTEGLRKSLEENKKAADGMAVTVKDAFTMLRNSLSVYVGESQSVTSATGLLSSAVVLLGENIETVVEVLTVAGSFALARYVAGLGASVVASGRAVLAARAQVAEELRLAQAHAATTAQTLAHVRANAAITSSSAQATAAANAHAAALARLQAAQAVVATAGRTLLGILGGPAGIVGLVAAAGVAIATMGSNAKTAAGEIDEMRGALERLDQQGLASASSAIAGRIDQTARLAIDAQDKLNALQNQLSAEPPGSEARNQIIAQMKQWGSVYGEAQKNLETLKRRQEEINQTITRRSQFSDPPTEDPKKDTEAQKRLKAMEQELELAKLTGVARARLAAIQRLGEDATEAEREEAARLAEEIYKLEQAQKLSTKTTKENAKVIAEMAQELGLAALKGEELAVAKARLRLTDAATPEEVARVEALARALYQANEAATKRAQFGSGEKADQHILGDTSPLSGGMFDEQLARYEAEAKAEEERYAGQLERLKLARELQIETQRSYNDLEEQATKDNAKRMMQIEQAKNQVMLSSGQDLFGALADAARQYVGESSGAYKALFAASKAFAIAQATLNLSTAMSQVMADQTALTPAQKFANMAAVASAGGQLISAISSASFGGGRQYGGPVASDKMYRINENGAPEILNTASGQQYLLPNTRGEVVSNKDSVAAQGGVSVSVVINNAPPGTTANVRQDADSDKKFIVDVMVGELMTEGRFTQTGRQHMGWRRQGT